MSGYPARVVVDLDAIEHNVRLLTGLAGQAQLMAVVKADAYGHGLAPVARAALAAGASWLGVAQVTEALALRAAGIDAPLLAWLYAPGAPLAECVAADIDLAVGSGWALAQAREAARSVGRAARVHLELDSGLGRGGLFLPEWTGLLHEAVAARELGEVELVGLWSHLARADDVEHPSITDQQRVFEEAVRLAREAGADVRLGHLANSAATHTVPGTHHDLVRAGIEIYGISPFEGRTAADLGLRPAMRLEASVALVKDAPAGQGVSYGHTYTTSRATRLAVVPIGYADGIPRQASNAGPVLVAGERLTVAGTICMDQFVLDIGDLPVVAGDTVVLFGGDGPSANDWAAAAGTIGYEIVSRIGQRVPREYTGRGASGMEQP